MSSDSTDKKVKTINEKLFELIATIDELLEEPVFLDNIDGEQELALDWTIEMLLKIKSKFEPEAPKVPQYPLQIADSYDAE